MRYVIMANGKGLRWDNYGGTPKCLITVGGETLLARTTRLVHEREPGAEVIISSSDPACETPGASRHAPRRGVLELDRFCYELIEDDTCFLYGDTYYTPAAIDRIMGEPAGAVTFFGNDRSIVAVKVGDGAVMREAVNELLWEIAAGNIEDARGWQLHHVLEGMPIPGSAPGEHLVHIADESQDFNEPQDWIDFCSRGADRLA